MFRAKNQPDPVLVAWSRDRCGFTIVELLVVIAVLGILASILLPSMLGARTRARRLQCLTNLREIYNVHAAYLMQERLFPPLNSGIELDPQIVPPADPENPQLLEELLIEGNIQYNYLIYDGDDFSRNFGPLVQRGYIEQIKVLYCPVQEDPYHSLATRVNPWPVADDFDTRAGYGRRHNLTEKSFSKLRSGMAIAADLLHLPKVVKSAHELGVNAVFGDGHATWVADPGIFTENDMSAPFDPLNNETMKKIWEAVDKGS